MCASAVGVLIQPLVGTDHSSSMNGVDIREFERINGGFRYLQGGRRQTPDDLVVDEFYARQHNLHVGR